jgi:hypothetical protein
LLNNARCFFTRVVACCTSAHNASVYNGHDCTRVVAHCTMLLYQDTLLLCPCCCMLHNCTQCFSAQWARLHPCCCTLGNAAVLGHALHTTSSGRYGSAQSYLIRKAGLSKLLDLTHIHTNLHTYTPTAFRSISFVIHTVLELHQRPHCIMILLFKACTAGQCTAENETCSGSYKHTHPRDSYSLKHALLK